MQRRGVIGFILLLQAVLLVSAGPVGSASAVDADDVNRLQRDLASILNGLVSCYKQSREPRFLEMALHLGEIKTHPLFARRWAKDQRNAAAERELLRVSARWLEIVRQRGCPPAGRERELCRLAQEYIRANDRFPARELKASLDLPASCNIAVVQKSLSPSQLLLKYVMVGERVMLIFISAGESGCEFLPVSRAQTVDMVERLAEPLEDFAAGRVDYLRIHFDMELASRLYDVLLKSVAERFPRADELFIIPDEVLFKVPFEALVTGFPDRFPQDDSLFSEYRAATYVIQDCKVSYFLSLADFLRHFKEPGEYAYTLAAFGHPQAPAPGQEGGIADASGDSFLAGRAAGPVPSTRLELLNLEKLFSGSRRRVFLGSDFNMENFSRFAPQARLIHLATHFFNDDHDPERSAFLFSASEKGQALCRAEQILKLRLPAELMILSACETTEKNLLGFRLLSGMTAAIRMAGVRDLIASLWPVDELSSQVVPLFYMEYLRGGGSASALRSSKLALMNRTISLKGGVRLSLAHPFLWANYVLYHFYR